MEKEKIVVFGAGGNIGVYFIDHLMQNLNDEFEIVAVGTRSQYPYEFYNGNYYQVNIVNKEDFNILPNNVYAVVDFAGVLPAYLKENNPQKYIDVNITGTLNILEYCVKSNAKRIVYTQTWADLNGYLSGGKTLKPYLLRKPIFSGDHAIYTVSKSAAVDLIECYHQKYGINNYILRLPNIYMYSPERYYYVDGVKKPISYRYMIDRAIKSQDIELWGNPKCGKDIIYVKDLCQMVYKSLFTECKSGVYNAGTGVKTSMLEQINGIIEVFSPKDNRSNIIFCPEKRDCDDFVMDISNIIEDLGYKPVYNYIEYLKDYKKMMNSHLFDKR